jgi:hypothetical protein
MRLPLQFSCMWERKIVQKITCFITDLEGQEDIRFLNLKLIGSLTIIA